MKSPSYIDRKTLKRSVMVAHDASSTALVAKKRELHYYAMEVNAGIEYRSQFKVRERCHKTKAEA